jgi:hypothetical protein
MAWREQEKTVDNSGQQPAGMAMSDMTYSELHDLDDDEPSRDAHI